MKKPYKSPKLVFYGTLTQMTLDKLMGVGMTDTVLLKT
jgi:hypothetical protein